jgi:hypothetical protein
MGGEGKSDSDQATSKHHDYDKRKTTTSVDDVDPGQGIQLVRDKRASAIAGNHTASSCQCSLIPDWLILPSSNLYNVPPSRLPCTGLLFPAQGSRYHAPID